MRKEDNAEIWNTIRSQQFRIDEYMEKIGLSLVIDDEGGFAFLKQRDDDVLPHLVKKQPLTFRMSLFWPFSEMKSMSTTAEAAKGPW